MIIMAFTAVFPISGSSSAENTKKVKCSVTPDFLLVDDFLYVL